MQFIPDGWDIGYTAIIPGSRVPLETATNISHISYLLAIFSPSAMRYVTKRSQIRSVPPQAHNRCRCIDKYKKPPESRMLRILTVRNNNASFRHWPFSSR